MGYIQVAPLVQRDSSLKLQLSAGVGRLGHDNGPRLGPLGSRPEAHVIVEEEIRQDELDVCAGEEASGARVSPYPKVHVEIARGGKLPAVALLLILCLLAHAVEAHGVKYVCVGVEALIERYAHLGAEDGRASR